MPFVGNSGQVNTLYEKNESSPGTSVRIVSGEVGTEISASGGLNLSIPLSTVTQVGNVTNDIVSFTNPQTGITVSSNAHVGGNMSAGYYYGDGSNLVGVSATTISPGASLSVNQVTTSGDLIVGGQIQGNFQNAVTPGSYLNGLSYDGSTQRTFDVDATTTATANKVVARDTSGRVYATSFHGDGSQLTGLPSTVNSTDDVPEGSSNQYYTDNRVDTHLNTGIATSGQVLSWNGSDYTWAVNGSDGIDTTQTLALTNATTGLTVSSNAVVTGNVTADYFVGDGGLLSNVESVRTFILGTNGSSDYTFTGPGFTSSTNDPVLILLRGVKYVFDNTANYQSHPFNIRLQSGGVNYTNGVVNNGSGITEFTVPMDAPSTLYYQCTFHTSMGNIIKIIDNLDTTQTLALTNATTGLTVSSNAVVTGNVTAGSFIGDGSQLTGLPSAVNSTDDVPEGSSNQYYTDNRVDTHLNTGIATSGQVLSWNGSDYTWAVNGSGGVDTTQTFALSNATTGLTVSSNAVVTGNVTAGSFIGDGSQLTGLPSAVNSTDDVPEGSSNQYYTDNRVDTHLNTGIATSGQVLSWNGSDYTWAVNGSGGVDTTQTFSLSNVTTGLTVSSNAVVTGNVTASSFIGDGSQLTGLPSAVNSTDDVPEGSSNQYYTDNRVDTHLNTGIATSGQVLSWNGSDYTWAVNGSGGIDTTQTLALSNVTTGLIVDSNIEADTLKLTTGIYQSDSLVLSKETGSDWVQRGLDIDGEAAGDWSGWSVSSSSDGTVVAIGSYYNDGTGSNAGHVRVWEWTGSAWSQRGLDIDGEAANDFSGWSVSLSSDGTVVAIGATQNDGTGADAGHVRVWEWTGSAWSQRGLDIDGEAVDDQSGYSVSLSSDGTVVAIGATRNDGTGSNAGHVRVWEWTGSAWSQRGLDIDGEAAGDEFGTSVSLSSDGTVVAIGARYNDGTASNAGHVQVWEWTGSAWSQRGLDIDGEAVDDNSGRSVSLSSDGTVVAIGAHRNDGTNGADSGHVRVWEWTGSAWSQRGLDIDGEAASDYSGFSVSLSSDGTVVAIGAILNDGTGSLAGHVRVWKWTGSAWSQVGLDIDGEVAGDQSGYSVSLSSDGTVVAIGAYLNSGNGGNSGHVRVYELPSWSQLEVDYIYGDGSNLTNISGTVDTTQTLALSNATTGLTVSSNAVVTGNVTADYFVGDGSNLTGISGGIDTTQTLALSNATTGLTVSSNAVVTGNVTADYFVGDGSNLTGISGGIDTTQTLALSNVTTGLTVSSNAVVTGNVTANSIYLIDPATNGVDIFANYQENFSESSIYSSNGRTRVYGPLWGSFNGIYTYVYLSSSTPVTGMGAHWNLSFRWWVGMATPNAGYSQNLSDLSREMRFIFFAPNALNDTPFSSNGGISLVFDFRYNVFKIMDQNDQLLTQHSVSWSKNPQDINNSSLWHEFEITFNNGVLTILEPTLTNTNITYNFNNSLTSVYNTQTYFGVVTHWDSYGSKPDEYIEQFYINEVVSEPSTVITLVDEITISGGATAGYFTGDGSNLTNISGTVDTTQTLALSNATTGLTVSSNAVVTGNVTADYFVGDGSNLTGISGGIDTTQTLALSNATTGLTVSSNAVVTGNLIGGDIFQVVTSGGNIIYDDQLTTTPFSGTLVGVTRTTATTVDTGYLQMNTAGSQDHTVYWNGTLGESWTCTFEWYKQSDGADDLRFIFYAPNEITSYNPATHGGSYVFIEFYEGDSFQIHNSSGTSVSSYGSINWADSAWVPFTITYNNGVLTASADNSGTNVSISYDFGTTFQSYYTSSSYFGFSGRTGGVSINQRIRNISIDEPVVNTSIPYGSQLLISSNTLVSGNVTADYFVGDGSNLVNVPGTIDTTQTLALTNGATGLAVSSNIEADILKLTTGMYHNDSLVLSKETGSDWVQRGLDIDGEAADDQSGYSVSLSSDGTVVAIGARYNDGTAGSNTGHVRVWEWDGSAWSQRGLDIDGDAANDYSGWSVSLSSDGTVVAIGAIYNDGTNGADSGHVRVWEWTGSAWSQRGLDIDGEAASDQSGTSVSLSSDGTVVAIGAISNDGAGTNAGHVRVWEWTGSAWSKRGLDLDGEAANDISGRSVSLSSDGTVVAIGAYYNDGTGTIAGHVRVYEWTGATWFQRGLDIDGEAEFDLSGYSVSLSSDGTVIAIGAPQNDGYGTFSGHVRVWEWDGSAWSQRGLDIDGEAANDESGSSVSLSSDGTVVAIGAIKNDGTGTDAGHVRVWEWTGSAWVQRGLDIDGEAASDQSGTSVSLSSDGTVVAIGALYNDGTGSNAGHVRVYALPSWSQLEVDQIYTTANVGIATSTAAYTLDVNGQIYASGAITENSDLRKKSNLEIIPNPIEKITQISGYTYDMNNTRRTGLIAQEVLDILPEAVVGNEEQGYGLAYGNIIGILVEAIKKLNERITILENN